MSQKEIELILLRQCASHLAMPIWLMGEKPGCAAFCSAERQMLRGMAKVSISLWSQG